ncbi:hypothetical protein ACLOJK_021778 [Asimina triloba]
MVDRLRCLRQIHGQIIAFGLEQNGYVLPKLAAACFGSKKIAYAHQVFDRIPHPNVFLWNAMLKGYSENGFYGETLALFGRMRKRDVNPNGFTLPFVVKSCMKTSAFREGKELHCLVLKSGFGANPYVGTMLIDMYSAGGEIELAHQVFLEHPLKNVVVWTAIVAGCISVGELESAHRLFDQAPERDIILWNTMMSAYVDSGDMLMARQIFNAMPTHDVVSWNTVLIGYANMGDFEAGERLFQEMPEKNVFSWNGLIGGYARNGLFFKALSVFKCMLSESEIKPNDTTLVTVLSACARLGALDVGRWVHVYAKNNGFSENTYVGNGLIDMYAKCGSIENAIVVFDAMSSKDSITWNSMIGALAMHGRAPDALNLFNWMKATGNTPDGVTFIGVLCACTHMGLVADGYTYFQSMVKDYLIVPQIEHYGCMVDLLGRAGQLSEAMDFIRKMPMKADCVIWSALLGACRIHKNVGLAEFAINQLIQIEPENVANFAVLSNIYGDAGRWEDVARLKSVMRDTGVRKLPGCSLIEVNDEVSEFHSLDQRHPQADDIYRVLTWLTEMSKSTFNDLDL